MKAERVYKELIWQDQDRMSGEICFYGTRVPVSFLFDYIEQDKKLEEFAQDYRIDVEVIRQVVHLAGEGIQNFLKPAA